MSIRFKMLDQTAVLEFRKLGRYRSNGLHVRGLCDPPQKQPRKILVDSRLSDKERTEVIIHECLHLAGWHIDESFVSQFSADLAELLATVKESDG